MNERYHLATDSKCTEPQLRAVTYRMLGSFSEVNDVWLRLSRIDTRVPGERLLAPRLARPRMPN